MIIVLTGAPGAGKGTQADLLVERMGFRKVSTGDALRKHIKLGTEVGKKAQQLVAAGKLVPDDVLFEVLRQELGSDRKEMILLDGYPRNVAQAKTLETLHNLHPVAVAIHLDVEKNELVSRLSGRRVCSNCGKSFHVKLNPPKKQGVCDACGANLIQREDDQAERIAVRLEVYESQTAPVLDFYRGKELYRSVDGAGEQEKVYGEIKAILSQ